MQSRSEARNAANLAWWQQFRRNHFQATSYLNEPRASACEPHDEEDYVATFSKAAGYGAVLIAALATATPALCGADVREGEGIVTKLGANASAITYWVNEPGGWHVVTTVDTKSGENADDEKHTIVSFSSSLLPGQSQLISVPAAVGEPQPLLRIRRLADGLEVVQVSAASD